MRKNLKKIAASLTLAFAMATGAQAQNTETAKPVASQMSDQQKITVGTLITAIKHGDTRSFYRQLDQVPDINAKNSIGITPLIQAAINGSLEMAIVLLDKGADINLQERDSKNATALMHAILGNHKDVAFWLIDHGADVNAQDAHGRTALMHAAGGRRFGIKTDTDQETQAQIVSKLIAAGANIETKTPYADHVTALTTAIANSNVAVANVLIKNGANVNTYHYESTLLHEAAERNTPEAEEIGLLLLQAGATAIDLKTASGLTPLMLASLSGKEKLATALIERGADVNQKGDGGVTPLMFAASNGQTALAKKLLEKGANPLLNDAYGWTAAFHATNYLSVRRWAPRDIETLLEKAEKDYAAKHPALARAKYNPVHKR